MMAVTETLIKIIAIFLGILTTAIATMALVPAYNALWNVPEQLADQSGNENLQTTVKTSKTIIETAEEAEDKYAFAKAVLGLALIIGIPASIIKGLTK